MRFLRKAEAQVEVASCTPRPFEIHNANHAAYTKNLFFGRRQAREHYQAHLWQRPLMVYTADLCGAQIYHYVSYSNQYLPVTRQLNYMSASVCKCKLTVSITA